MIRYHLIESWSPDVATGLVSVSLTYVTPVKIKRVPEVYFPYIQDKSAPTIALSEAIKSLNLCELKV